MTWLHNVCSNTVAADGYLNSAGSVTSGDSSSHSGRRLDRDGEVCVIGRIVLVHHERQLQMLAALMSESKANQATRIGRHKINIFGAHTLGGNNEITFVLSIFIVHQYHHLSLADVVDDLFYRIQLHIFFKLFLIFSKKTLFKQVPN
jgi:hypothetical protein